MTHAGIQVRRRRRCGGFSLLELMIVGMLGILVLTIISHAWKWYSHFAQDNQITATLAGELKAATDSIAADYGSASASHTIDGDQVQLDVDSNVIEYKVLDGALIRRDTNGDSQVVIAAHIEKLNAAVVESHLQIQLTAKIRTTEQALTLQLQGS